ncbi:MAG: hypothetical protein HKN84_02255 [Gammaproteobacteria bacterium]|nr:hypothetical protein [Gammaproteobacteria bacterium]
MSNLTGCGRIATLIVIRRVFSVGALLGLAACSGDGGTGIADGQSPDPVAIDFPIAYTKGPLLDAQMQQFQSPDLRDQMRFNVGTDLYFRDRASPSAADRNITVNETQGVGDVQGVEISVDGSIVLFAMRGPFDPNLADEDQPTWNIWEYEIATDTLQRVISDDLTAEDGHDISPHYLPDGRIVFASTRQHQQKATLLLENKPQYEAEEEDRNESAFVLHVMDDDGENLRQISFNQSHDFEPTVLDDGRVLFSRWDNAGNVNGVHLYRMNPDGSELELLYGAESHLTGTGQSEVQFIGARELPDGRIMAIARPAVHPELGGDVIIIDTPNFVEDTQPTAINVGMAGPAQSSATPLQVRTDLLPSPGGRFASAFPLWDGTDRVLVSWNICRVTDAMGVIFPCDAQRLADPAFQLAPPLYGIWMYDPADQTQLPIVVGEEGMLIGDIVAAQSRANPQVILDKAPGFNADAELASQDVGIINIRSVYDIDGVDVATPDIETVADPAITTADERVARFLRIEKPVPLPNDDVLDFANTAFGVSAQQGMREILGYAPIEPDGSVRVKVPANVPFAISVLNADGRRITPRHQNWLQVLPGDELQCNGCHDPTSGLSHGRSDSFDSVYVGATSTGVPFPNTDSALFTDFGETMAETRSRIDCAADITCPGMELSVDVIYEDFWTDPVAAGRAADARFAYRYLDDTITGDVGLQTTPPTTLDCTQGWSSSCRIVINYEQHIHPIWELPRLTLDPNDPNIVLNDRTCTTAGCHTFVGSMNTVQQPAAQLDLTDGPSQQVPDHKNAYQELLVDDNVTDAAGADVLVPSGQLDINGNPILVPVSVGASMSPAGALASDTFFSRFDAGGTHAGDLSPAELRLISEWLDLGAQYFNNPFDPDVPLN